MESFPHSFTRYEDDYPILPSLHYLDLTLPSADDKIVGLYIEKYLNMDSFSDLLTSHQDVRTLPSLRSLDLPMPSIGNGFTSTLPTHDCHGYIYATPNINTKPPKLHVPEVPMSSPSTSVHNSCAHPPTSAETSSVTSANRGMKGFRIVPCEPEKADAALLLIEPDVGEKKTLLLFGPMAESFLKLGQGAIGEGARVLPYKIAPSRNPKHYDTSILSVISYKAGDA